MMSDAVTVSVIMPVYNAETYLSEAIESILQQTYQDFEFIIVNDGSTDKSESIILEYQQRDPRIIYYSQHNQGVAPTLNFALANASGEFIARMDADDISLPHRFEKQLEFLQSNPSIGLCGTGIEYIGEKSGIRVYPVEHDELAYNLLFQTSFCHPAVMLRRSLLMQNDLQYRNMYTAEDYDLWRRIVKIAQVANLPDILFKYRIDKTQITNYKQDELYESVKQIIAEELSQLQIEPESIPYDLHRLITSRSSIRTRQQISDIGEWLITLYSSNCACHIYNEEKFSQWLGSHWYRTCRFSDKHDISLWQEFIENPLSQYTSIYKRFKLYFRCFFRK